MKIKVAEKDKDDKSFHEKLYVSIYEDDYKKIDLLRTACYPLIDNYPAIVRFEFYKSALNVSLRRKVPTDRYTIRMHVKCERLDFSRTLVSPSSNWSDWISMGKIPREDSSSSNGKIHYFEINLNLCELKNKTYLNLYDDKFFSDIYLVSGGSFPANVAMHRAVLCAHSRMFKSWLQKDWKDDTEVKVKIKEASHQTLLDLKTYVYYGILPDKNLLDLLQIARNYCFEDLMKDCIFELVNVVNSENLLEYRQFAIDYELPELLRALKHITAEELVKTSQKLQMLKISQVHDKDLARKDKKSSKDTESPTKPPATKDRRSPATKDKKSPATKDKKSPATKDKKSSTKDTRASTSKDTRASSSKDTRASTSKTKDIRPLKYRKEKSSIFDP